MTTKTESKYLGRLARLGCIVCRQIYPEAHWDDDGGLQAITCIHHVREGQGGAQRAQDWMAIPLCELHHTGKYGVHQNGNKIVTPVRLDEIDLLALTWALYLHVYGDL